MHDPNYDEDDASSNGIVYTVDIETRNHKLNDGQRKALRDALMMVLTELSIKMELVVGQPHTVKVKGYINTSSGGRRELVIPDETVQRSAPQPEPVFNIGGVGMKD